jgi:LAO/AO transport system kinase
MLSRIEGGDLDDVSMPQSPSGWIVGITGPPGAGKSTLVSALVSHIRSLERRVAVLAVDPSSPRSGGALLGDRIRMSDHVEDQGVFIRSLASRGHLGGLALAVPLAAKALLSHGFDEVLIETIGVGQSEVDIAAHADTTVLVQAPGMGDELQAGKAGILEIADVIAVNKADREGAAETAKQLSNALHVGRTSSWRVPVVPTQATSRVGIEALYEAIDCHRRVIRESGELDRRRRSRNVTEWRERCRLLANAELDRALASSAGHAIAQQVFDGTSTAADAAQLVVRMLATSRSPTPACTVSPG